MYDSFVNPDILVGILVLVIFLIGAALMFTRKMPALLVLPLMAVAIVMGTWLCKGGMSFQDDILKGVIGEGTLRLHGPIIVAFFGGMLSFMMQKTGVAESMIKNAAELIGDNPLMVSLGVMAITALVFTSIGGLGAIIMVAIVFLPMLATVGVPPTVSGGILLIGFSIGGVMNAGNWVLYIEGLGVPVSQVKGYALTVFVLMMITGTVFVCVELWRARAVRSIKVLGGTMAGAIAIGAVLVFALTRASVGEGTTPFEWKVFSADFRELVEIPGEETEHVERASASDSALEAMVAADFEEPVMLIQTRYADTDAYRAFLPQDPARYNAIKIPMRTTVPVDVAVSILVDDGKMLAPVVRNLEPFGTQEIIVPFKEFEKFIPEHFNGLVVSIQKRPAAEENPDGLYEEDTAEISPAPAVAESAEISAEAEAEGLPIIVTAETPVMVPKEITPLWRSILQWAFAAFFLLVLILVLLDLRKRLRRWQLQEVTIKWYAYLIPLVPLALILVFNVDILASFFIGFVYAVLVTLRPGSMSLTIQSMLQGAGAVLPAAMLMIGIGIMLTAVLGPPGWSAAHGGASWPVSAALEPLFEMIVPKSPVGYVVLFSICAPLALYRGPLNIWGLGFGVAGILITAGLSTAAVMAMLMTVGQVQGVCDPTNTHNVWLANEVRVDVQALLWRTLPYIWGMAIVGLIIASFRVF